MVGPNRRPGVLLAPRSPPTAWQAGGNRLVTGATDPEPLLLLALVPWRGGRAVECAGLENRYGLSVHRGFESPPLRRVVRVRLRRARLRVIPGTTSVQYRLGPL